MIEIPIIYEDSELVVIDKPVGIICNRAQTVKVETLQDWWGSRYQTAVPTTDDEKYFAERQGLVHRLDRETSGVMVMAKTVKSFVELLRQFKERETQKEYLALTHGIWEPKKGLINLPIGRAQHDRQMMAVREDGRESETEYTVIREWKNLCEEYAKPSKVNTKGYVGFSQVRFAPKTGRMHQIRVHAKHLGHPLVGDDVYAGRKRSREDRKWSNHIMLTAISLTINHPVRGRMTFTSKAPDIELATSKLC